MPLGNVTGVGPDAMVSPMGRPLSILAGEGLLGRVLDGLGEPMDDLGPLVGHTEEWSVDRPAPDPLAPPPRRPPAEPGGAGHRFDADGGGGPAHRPVRGRWRRQVDADGADCPQHRGRRQRHLPGGRARSRSGGVHRGLAGRRGPVPLGRGLRHQRRPQPGPPEVDVRRHLDRRVVPRSGAARAVHDGLGHPLRPRPARGRSGRGRAARPPGLSPQRVRHVAAAAGTDRQLRSGIDHRALHRAGRRRRHGRADRRRSPRYPRRPHHPGPRAGRPEPLAGHRRAAIPVARDAAGDRGRAPPGRGQGARAAGHLRAPARPHPAGRLPGRQRPAHRRGHRQDRRHQRLPPPGDPREHARFPRPATA